MEDKKTEKKGFSRLSPLLNLCPAVLVVVLIVTMLPATSPVLGEIPELLAIHADAAHQEGSEKSEKESEPHADGNFEDGVYTGTGAGYGGTITVQVTVENGNIVSVEILSAPGETASFMRRAEGVIDLVIQNQSWEVDVISGATYSSKGILAAIQNALTGEKVETETAPVQETEALVEEVFEEPEGYQDGTYYGSARGFGGTIQVKVVISDGKIADISIVSASGETPSYMSSAKAVVSRILSAQSPNVDTVSGATYSSNGIMNAVKAALRQAAGSNASEDLEDDTELQVSGSNTTNKTKKPVVQTTVVSEDGYVDGVYDGTAEGFGGDITVQVSISNGDIASIEIISAEDETPSYLVEASVMIDRILGAQNLDVDTVSGATYSSVGIINAVADALSKAMPASSEDGSSEEGENTGASNNGNNGNSDTGTASGSTEGNSGTNSGSSTAGNDANNTDNGESNGGQTAAGYKDGVYTGEALCTDDDMFTYTVYANVTVEEGVITDIQIEKINDQSDYPEDNDSYMEYAINGRTRSGVWYEGVVKQIIDNQRTDTVDVVSRATYSSNAIAEAVRNALENAVEVSESPAEDEGQENTENESDTQDSSVGDSKEESTSQDGSAGASKEESSSQGDSSDKSGEEQTSAAYKDGTYTGEALCFEDDWFTYTVLAAITVKDGILTDIQVEKINDQSEVPEDNEPYMEYAINGRTRKNIWYEGVVKQILDSQSTENVDAVSSATYSSNAIVEAVNEALKQAAGEKNVAGTVAETEETVMETSKDESALSVMNTILMAWNNLFDKSTEGSFRG